MRAGSNVSELRGARVRNVLQPRARGLAVLAGVIVVLPLLLANNYFYEVAILVALYAVFW